LSYPNKLANHANFIKIQNKKNYEVKFSTTLILKNKINKKIIIKKHLIINENQFGFFQQNQFQNFTKKSGL
jgi:hypothetical protein